MPVDISQARRNGLNENRLRKRGWFVLLALCLAVTLSTAQVWRNPGALKQQLSTRFGAERLPLLNDWLSMIASASTLKEDARLERVNNFINRRIAFDDDISVWEKSDYWATPLETIGQGSGDCEDLAIIKYVSLRMAGVPARKLRLIYAKARVQGVDGPVSLAHMVLAYYSTPDAAPLILDNLNGAILPAAQRKDLQPIFSFNSDAIFTGISGRNQATEGGIGRLSRWEEVWRRILAEGYE